MFRYACHGDAKKNEFAIIKPTARHTEKDLEKRANCIVGKGIRGGTPKNTSMARTLKEPPGSDPHIKPGPKKEHNNMAWKFVAVEG